MIESEVINVTGMKCGGCESNISGKLMSISGVISVVALFKANEVTVEFDPEIINLEAIKDTIIEAGFTVNS